MVCDECAGLGVTVRTCSIVRKGRGQFLWVLASYGLLYSVSSRKKQSSSGPYVEQLLRWGLRKMRAAVALGRQVLYCPATFSSWLHVLASHAVLPTGCFCPTHSQYVVKASTLPITFGVSSSSSQNINIYRTVVFTEKLQAIERFSVILFRVLLEPSSSHIQA